MVSAIIVAAGKGVRMKADQKKQYLHLGGIPIFIHTLKRFSECRFVENTLLLVPPPDVDCCRELVLEHKGILGDVKVIAGGMTRQESVYNGLVALEKDAEEKDLVVIHDGVRPLVSRDMIETCIHTATETGACIVAVPASDTLKRVKGDSDIIYETLPRQGIRLAQTPQVFWYKLIRDAHDSARDIDFEGTDDAALVERMPFLVHMVPGSRVNIKITTREDLLLAEALLEKGT